FSENFSSNQVYSLSKDVPGLYGPNNDNTLLESQYPTNYTLSIENLDAGVYNYCFIALDWAGNNFTTINTLENHSFTIKQESIIPWGTIFNTIMIIATILVVAYIAYMIINPSKKKKLEEGNSKNEGFFNINGEDKL
ncbi:MAG: hypothetical protein ACTSVU_08760, partial [Promethearchaeota archaeon]